MLWKDGGFVQLQIEAFNQVCSLPDVFINHVSFETLLL